ncbi:pre-rRNA 2'-O-ribose RNA methyltransferase-like [Helianthus annuus]|uniref:pre-rRNA 2'-O-ribose RNA methyltransferase-like n=1 Tax=Helianthus annuus TaxID=4232 RepID=UPI0016532E12|nr:pre-rRNA 2'-O-ribose RNA methyltransferase-like [Helianthus annuus]
MLVDEPEEDEAEAETEAEGNVEGDQVSFTPESVKLLKAINKEIAAGNEGDVGDKSSSSSSDEEIDETERARRIKAEIEKEKQLKRKRKEDTDDELYNPSPEHVIESQTPPSSGGRKKQSARKKVATPRAKGLKILLKKKPVQKPKGISLEEIGDFDFANNEQVKKLEKKVEEVLVENKRLVDREKKLEKRVKSVEDENSSLLKKTEADRTEIDILKVKVAELEEEKACRDEQNKYFELKNKELEVAKAMKEHEIYMMNKVLENMLGKSIEQRFEEIKVEEVRAKRQAEIDAQMKNKGKGVEEDEEEEDGDGEKTDDPDDVTSASSHSDDDDDDDDDDGQGGTGIKVTKASNEQNVDDFLHDDANEDHESVEGEGEQVDDQSVDKREKLILRLEPEVEEGEFRHVYTMNDIKEMTRINDPDFKFDFEEELNAFDINQQPDYEYKYVEEADVYDRVEVEDCTDEESVTEDTSNFPTLVEFFSQENADELRRKVAECLKDKNFDGTTKDAQKEERKKWFRKSNERKFKRPLKFYKRDRDVSLGDIISWGFLPQVNVYAIRREFRVQYFEYIQDIMSLPSWDVEELSKVRTLDYPVRKHDVPIWGLMKFEACRGFKHWKPHYLKKVRRVNPETGNEETILHVKKPRVIKNIPVPKMEQDFHKGFLYWVYSCLSTQVVIIYRAENEIRNIFVYDPLWLVNYSAKDIECLFVNKIGFKAEDKEQAMQFQRVVSISFQKGINADNKWNSKWREIEKEEALKAEKRRKAREDKDNMLRHTFNQRMAAEEKKRVDENEKLRKLLMKKPKPREEKFKSL